MKKMMIGLAFAVAFSGCQRGTVDKAEKQGSHVDARPSVENKPTPLAASSGKEARIAKALAELGPEDRKLAEAQKFCAVQNKSRLGSMGAPVKLMVKGEPVFLCCDHCQKPAEANPEKTLAQAAKLKAANH